MTKSKQPATERIVSYVTPSSGYWIIPSENEDFYLAQALTPAMTQEDAAKLISPEGFALVDVPTHIRLFKAMYDLRDKGGKVEKARMFLQTTMRNNFPNTSTRVAYMPKGKDVITHGYGTKSPSKIRVKFVGEDGLVDEVLSQEASLALTGKKPEEVAEVMSYLNQQTPAYLWRVNSKPSQIDERVAWFDSGSSGAYLYCSGDPTDRVDSLRVRVVRKKN
jgi:hypothetical protein